MPSATTPCASSATPYHLADFMRTLALPDEVEHWSLTRLVSCGEPSHIRRSTAGIWGISVGAAAGRVDHQP
jgi:hypothetical protein